MNFFYMITRSHHYAKRKLNSTMTQMVFTIHNGEVIITWCNWAKGYGCVPLKFNGPCVKDFVGTTNDMRSYEKLNINGIWVVKGAKPWWSLSYQWR